jgi:hypothetical protein
MGSKFPRPAPSTAKPPPPPAAPLIESSAEDERSFEQFMRECGWIEARIFMDRELGKPFNSERPHAN